MQKKNLLLIFSLFAVTAMLQAQITITNATFPVAGDSLKTATDLAPTVNGFTPPGGPQTWDFTGLNASTRQVTVFQPAANGTSHANFPGAELVVIGAAGAETYFDVSSTAFSVLGISGFNLGGGLPLSIELKFVPPMPERHAPLAFFDIHQSTSNAIVAIPTSAIPGGILDSLGVPSGLFDSIRIRRATQRLEVVDAFGTLSIPGGSYDVLRQKRTDYVSTALDVHTFLGWVDISTLLGGQQIPGIGTDTTVTFHFLNNIAKEPIAVVTFDASVSYATQVEYKDLGVVNAVEPVTSVNPEVIISPNPVSTEATFELKNSTPGQYTLRMFDTNGKTVLIKQITSDHETISLASLSGGLYLYHVTDVKNKIVASGKLMKSSR